MFHFFASFSLYVQECVTMINLEVVIVKDQDALLQGDLCRGEGEQQQGGEGGQQHGLKSWHLEMYILYSFRSASANSLRSCRRLVQKARDQTID